VADWKDFYEDNRESWGQYLDSLDAKKRPREALRAAAPSPRVEFCPLCHAAFIENGLAKHIRSVHGPQHIYLRVNGRIIRDLGWAEQGISELSLVQLGFPDATVELTAAGFRKELQVSGNENLRRRLPSSFEGELTVRVTPSSAPARQFTVYARSLPEFRRDDLDSVIQQMSEEDRRKGAMPDIGRWRAEIGHLGVLEQRYLDGFFEYTLSFYLEQRGHSKMAKQHFEDALGLLLPFRTPLAHSAQCVLGIRMNCFGVLARAPSGSVVAASDKFFNKPFPSEWNPASDCDAANPFMTYADEFTIRLVSVTASFYGDDEAVLVAGLEALSFHPSGKDRNNEDKLALLEARSRRRYSQVVEACRAYELLRYHPLFGNEAEEYIHGKPRE
jgi:hypothetical protein